ncbi:SET domain-containing protein SmydA-8, isoform B [Frankliniella fusca]|uniref:SET domain-containing protein SmydA-8, isoform B n=1 Tax=Frankliniella fusca TaxID=407009 RepID=A0AAE1HF45_9NEOP|nr:SET domain-containing protein SmydA-8, isoform B [Frankliniella fusca]
MLGFLRVLLLRGDKATRCRQLESHQEKVLDDPRVRWQMDALAPQLMPCLRSFTLEQRCWAYGVMETNSFSYEERHDKREALVLMEKVSLFGHSCVCNSFGNCYYRPEGATGFAALLGLRKVLVAATDIEPGQDITVSYEHPHLPTALRRSELMRTKFFMCHCKRCEDPAELGLHTGALCCQVCLGESSVIHLRDEVEVDPGGVNGHRESIGCTRKPEGRNFQEGRYRRPHEVSDDTPRMTREVRTDTGNRSGALKNLGIPNFKKGIIGDLMR